MEIDVLLDGLPTPFVPVDDSNTPIPAYMWVLLNEFSSTENFKQFEIHTMLLATSLFKSFVDTRGVDTWSGGKTNPNKIFLQYDVTFPDVNFLKPYIPALPFEPEEIKSLTSWPIFLLSVNQKKLLKDFVVNSLWVATCQRFGLGKAKTLPASASKFLLTGAYWLNNPQSFIDTSIKDWEILNTVIDRGTIKNSTSLGRFPAWVYPAILYKKNLLGDELFYHLITHVFLLEMVMCGAVYWECHRWKYSRSAHKIESGSWLSYNFIWTFATDKYVLEWFSDINSLNFEPKKLVSENKRIVAEKLYKYALEHIDAENWRVKLAQGTSYIAPDAKRWYEQVSEGKGWSEESENTQWALSAALQDPRINAKVREIKNSLDKNAHADTNYRCCIDSLNKKLELNRKTLEELKHSKRVLEDGYKSMLTKMERINNYGRE